MNKLLLVLSIFGIVIFNFSFQNKSLHLPEDSLKNGFLNPPDSVRPGVYWYFMDGNLSKEGMTADLESMKAAGIGNLVFLEVNVGIPRGEVDFLSEQWQDLFKHAMRETERLGISVTLGVGPGWSGSGGPWVTGRQSMQHLVSVSLNVNGNDTKIIHMPKPTPKAPYFGEGGFTPELKKRWDDYYEDVALLAFPTPTTDFKIKDIDEKALYYRAPYTSVAGVKPFLPTSTNYSEPSAGTAIPSNKIIDITSFLQEDGTVNWKAPKGKWTIVRFGSRNNGAVTRPAPMPGLGFEADKMDTASINDHMAHFTGQLFTKIGIPDKNKQGGLKTLHMDSWEMGAQNWSPNFRSEFKKRRGYDPLPYFPVYAGLVIGSVERSERFLWDLRQTAQELVIVNHAKHLKEYGKRYNLRFSIEPYDMNPTADMELGAVADVPMAEFWSKGYGFNSSFSCIQAASIAHVNGQTVVAAEAFTADHDAWKQYPGSMKNQGDWAFVAGINRFVFHTFQHQFLADSLKPGMTMGPYGVHWDRGQTWWPMAYEYHRYISRCQYLLQQGKSNADILYLTPEGAPQVFRAPSSAMSGDDLMPDRKRYNFDGCSPSQLKTASVKNGRILFPGGSSYRVLVLPAIQTMTPGLLVKLESLVKQGAVVIGMPPSKSPSLVNYPNCDKQVAAIAGKIWGGLRTPNQLTEQKYGNGKVYWGGNLSLIPANELYPTYESVEEILQRLKVIPDFESDSTIRYTHRSVGNREIYFVSNKTLDRKSVTCRFRSIEGNPELWDPMTGETRPLSVYHIIGQQMEIPIDFDIYQSFFIVIDKSKPFNIAHVPGNTNFKKASFYLRLEGPWTVSFDPKWGGPKQVVFDRLQDWTLRGEEGIKYYSGIAKYHQEFQIPDEFNSESNREYFINLGDVCDMARVWINGKDMGVVWTDPFQLKITNALKPGKNQLVIEVANRWPNRLIGDERLPYDGIKDEKWPDWLLKKQARTSGRFTFTTANFYSRNSALLSSGLLGPVRILVQ